MRIRKEMLWWLLLALPLLFSRATSQAQTPVAHRAALVVRFGDGHTETHIVHFSEESLSGLELLQRSGLAVITNSGLICTIGADGCPSGDCFCQCSTSSPGCSFWRYFHWKNNQWAFSGSGASEYRVRDGDIEGWVWGDNSVSLPLINPDGIFDPGVPQSLYLPLILGAKANGASVVVRFSDSHVVPRSVIFPEAELPGTELLRRTGLNIITAVSPGMGEAVCKRSRMSAATTPDSPASVNAWAQAAPIGATGTGKTATGSTRARGQTTAPFAPAATTPGFGETVASSRPCQPRRSHNA